MIITYCVIVAVVASIVIITCCTVVAMIAMIATIITYCVIVATIAGIAHRDLKPSNIVCVYPGRLTPLKLIDFDLASEYIYDSSSPRKCVSTPRLRSPVRNYFIFTFVNL